MLFPYWLSSRYYNIKQTCISQAINVFAESNLDIHKHLFLGTFSISTILSKIAIPKLLIQDQKQAPS